MVRIVDASAACGSRASALAAAGVKTVIRYYSRDTLRQSKRLARAEAQQFAKAGLRLAIVHEGRFGDQVTNYDRACGIADARYARTYGASEIGQPAGSAIYFGIDFDASAEDIQIRLIPYFQGIADVFGEATDEPRYLVGVYGSGATCDAILSAGRARLAWLAQSTGWAGYKQFLESGRWSLSQGMPVDIGGVACDPNQAGNNVNIGDFILTPGQAALQPQPAPFSAAVASAAAPPMFVNARSGLHLRSGPGIQFGIMRLLLLGTPVHVLKPVDAWSSVDLQGDGVADGFVSSAFLAQNSPSQGPSGPKNTFAQPMRAAQPIADAIHIPELIRQGSSADGLKAARETAAKALASYPTNGCAAHLSVLLQQAGIDVAMTFGAGKLMQVLTDRGWSKIEVGEQQQGDVGVCFDNTSPPGADHIYLVISTSGLDEMMIADNQRDTDAVHERFASGHGKTPTEYFLRAT